MVFAAAILSAQTRVDNSRAMDSILVKDWVPDSSLVVSETNIAKARFPAIDVHVHVGANRGDTQESLAAWVKTMDEAGVEKMIVLTEATGAEFDRLADLYRKNFPNRFQLSIRAQTKLATSSQQQNKLKNTDHQDNQTK